MRKLGFRILACLTLLLSLIIPAQARHAEQETRHTGRLQAGDTTLIGGEYYDTYTFQAQAGQTITVNMSSSDFDTYLIVAAPSEEQFENDDHEGDATRSRVEVTAAESGSWSVLATSYDAEEAGAYVVVISISTPAQAGGGTLIESGRLDIGDETLDTGEYVDEYSFSGQPGESLVIDLRSSDFDPYLVLVTPGGEQFDNDDHEGDATRSLISLELTESGQYEIGVTSYTSGESGSYTLRIIRSATGATAAGPRVERGSLEPGDQTLSRTGEYADEYSFEGLPGQQVRLDVSSTQFDTYLIFLGPGEFRHENDDVEDAPLHSIIEADLTEAGSYRVLVTSYQPGETGSYELQMEFSGAAATSDQRDVAAISIGETRRGRLDPGDNQLDHQKYWDMYVFDGVAGQNIVVEMNSSEFDTYLGLLPPSGEEIENDDADGLISRSRIELALRETGRYRIVATSYAGEETGDYELVLRADATGTTPGRTTPGSQRVFGVFVGISDYGGRMNDLSYTADDARRVAAALNRGAGMATDNSIILTDRQATADRMRNAFQEMGSRVGPDDVFVFFYSGHGDRVPRSTFQSADPDNLDETIELYDESIRDDEMNELLALINGRVSLVMLDACFSGGFSKDIISAPGRMGLFSSEEDVTSQVAAKFRAGGYLAQFLADAIGDRLADADGDRQLTALELSQYLHERYRADVKSGGDYEYVRTGGPRLGYQHLVVDRGSVGPYDVIFR